MRQVSRDRWISLLLIAPSVIAIAVFVYGFIAFTGFSSLTKWASLTPDFTLVGFRNYARLFTIDRFLIDLRNTVNFTILFLAACLALGLVLALLLDQKVKGEAIFRNIFLFPMAISFIVTGVVWRWLLNPGTTQTGSSGVNLLFERYFDEVRVSEDSAAGYETGCWGIRLAADGVELAEAVADRDGLGENDVAWGNCDPDETIDREFIARLYWERLAAPPPPTPLRVRPGEARVGVPAYLEIGGPNPASQAFDTPIGRLTFAMTPRYVVTWGDGASSTTASQGAPPGGGPGAIIHTYTDHGAVTITVAAHWRATWTLGPFSGDLPELIAPTAASLDLQVEQRQATVD
mgnify:CR=1 FL=1